MRTTRVAMFQLQVVTIINWTI